MLSVENPSPDPPPCSSTKSDDRVFNKLAFQEGLESADDDDDNYHEQQQLPSFSIRDYVLTARHKDIEKNWPFSQQLLQLCSKHEIKVLLPPFKPPDSIRNRCLRKGGPPQLHSKKAIVGEAAPLQAQRSFCSRATPSLQKHKKQRRSSNHAVEGQLTKDAESERESTPGDQLHSSPQEDSSTLSQSPVDHQNLHLPSTPKKSERTVEPSGKKCRLIVRLGPISDTIQSEDITSNTTTVSDSMASKVCPVCKAFSSTSNTTLNAHIDQCLAVESTSELVMNDTRSTKHIAKPRKKRSMVDIYATAPRCTLEELDRRNGSNWAAGSNLPTAEAKTTNDEKRQRLSGVDREGISDESPVYFDSNGVKLRILSKLSNSSMSTAGDAPLKLRKDGNESKVISFEMQEHSRPKSFKHRKQKPRNRKLCSLETNEDEISGEQEMNHGMGKSCGKEESLSQLLKARDGIIHSESGTLRQWVCSKRTGRLKRFSGTSSTTRNTPIERDKMNLDPSLGVNSVHANPSENVVSSPKSTHEDSTFHESQVTEYGTDSHTRLESRQNPPNSHRTSSRQGGCMLTLSNFSGMFVSSPRSKRVEVNASPTENLEMLPRKMNRFETCNRISMKGKERLTVSTDLMVKPSFSKSKCKLNGIRSASKKPWIHKSITEMDDQVGTMPMPLNVDDQYHCLHGSPNNLPDGYLIGAVAGDSDGRSNKVRPEAEGIIDHLSFDEDTLLTSRCVSEASRISEREKSIFRDASLSIAENHDLDADATVGSHVRAPSRKFWCSINTAVSIDGLETDAEELPVKADNVSKTFSSPAVSFPVSESSKTVALESCNLTNSFDAQLNSMQSTEKSKSCVCATGKMMNLMQQNLLYRANQVGRLMEDAYIVPDVNSRVVGNFSSEGQSTRCQTDPPYIYAPPRLLLPSPWNMDIENLQENSSLTSSKTVSSLDSHTVVKRDSSGSPVSATSTISQAVLERYDSKHSEPKSFVERSAAHNIIGFSDDSTELVVGNATSSPFIANADGAERIILNGEECKSTTTSQTEESVKFTDNQPCCCSRKRSHSFYTAPTYQDSQFLNQTTRESPVMPAKGNLMAYSTNIEPETYAKPDLFPASGNSVLVTHSHEAQDVQSTSTPVLRLMGKNLMVVNKDENAFLKLRQPPPGSSSNSASTNYIGFSTGGPRDRDCASYHNLAPQGSVIFSQESYDDLSKSYGSYSGSKTCQKLLQPLLDNRNNMDIGGVDSSSARHVLKSRTNLRAQQKGHIDKLDSCAYNFERVVTPADLHDLNLVSAIQMRANPSREIIVIDDSPESESEFSRMKATYTERVKRSQPSPEGALASTSSYPYIPLLSAGCCHTSSNTFSRREPLERTIWGENVSPPKWGGTSKGSGVAMRNPFTSAPASTSTCRTSQAMYHSPSFL
ncbi:hypothetical protein IFM89_001314 [Coptis chinensis]|uniref:Uncharacterized protein n=1 Tax=Coptis chinensis TaxID=261450 RepID=A0A835GU21_9MAGN|nr:hypothetical protein IFM89_001314 [Coptis chinensis]